MAIFGRRQKKKQKEMEKQFARAQAEERARQDQMRRDQMQRDVLQTTEGHGIMEGANISLGFDEEEEDDLLRSMTGLVV